MDHGLMQDLAHFASEALETASFAVILGAVAISTVLFLMHLGREDFEANYRAYRANLGRGHSARARTPDRRRHHKIRGPRPDAAEHARARRHRDHPHLPFALARRRDQRPLAVGDDAVNAAAGPERQTAGTRRGVASDRGLAIVSHRRGLVPAMHSV